jgi:Glycosyl transferase family 2
VGRERPNRRYETDFMTELRGVSIIIVNYNNGRFLAAAIDSALCQDHPLCEVIVVDDLSTDDSRAVIAGYGDQIRSLLRETNGHQIAALNSAWPLARYPILIFLDSDDLLLPHAASRIAGDWKSETVKAQFPLESIDSAGQPIRHVAPKYPLNLNTATIRAELLRSGQCPSSPGSGNAYSRLLLERISNEGGFELDDLRNYWMDNILECNAPFYGEVVTINEPLACYRVHDSNLFLQSTIDPASFARMSSTFGLKLDYLARRCQSWGIPFDPATARNRSLWLLECRLAAAKLASTDNPSRAPTLDILFHGIKACMCDPAPMTLRIARMLWFVSVAAAPRGLARRVIALRFLVEERPQWIKRLFGGLVKLKRFSLRRSSSVLCDIPGNGGAPSPQQVVTDHTHIRVCSR